MNDKGQPGISNTVANFANQPKILAVAGAYATADAQSQISYFTVKGVKFALLAYTTTSINKQVSPYGVNIYSDTLADSQITAAKSKADLVLVAMHWGTDYSPTETADQTTIAQHLADKGVDIVLGMGPHVIEPVKVLSGASNHQTIVWYSLGNFLNSQVPVETLIGGFAVMDIDTSTKFLHNPRFLPVYMHYEWTAAQKARASSADLQARHNFTMVPLDQAGDLLSKSQNNTTVAAQTDRVKAILNKYFTVPVITANDY